VSLIDTGHHHSPPRHTVPEHSRRSMPTGPMSFRNGRCAPRVYGVGDHRRERLLIPEVRHMRSGMISLVALVLVVAGLTVAVPARAQTFSSAVWQLDNLPGVEGGNVTPSSRFTIQFRSDGTVAVQADCIRASGLWSGDLSITITQATIESCSVGEDFLVALDEEVTGYTLSGSTLRLHRGSSPSASSDIVLVAAPV